MTQNIQDISDNVLTRDEADDMESMSPGDHAATSTYINEDIDHPSDGTNQEDRFLTICFEKSPHMRMSDLKRSQEMDPRLKQLREKCAEGPLKAEGAEYSIHQGILIRTKTKNDITTHQICLSATAGYNLALRLHTGAAMEGWRRVRGMAPHYGPRKLQNLISQRFHRDSRKLRSSKYHNSE